MMKVIGILGSKGAGKDTFARYAREFCQRGESDESVRISHFAEPLKEAAKTIFGLSFRQMHEPALKELVDPRWGKSPRQLMQLLGTEVGRAIDPEVWVKSLVARVDSESSVRLWLVPDCRFANEARALRRIDAKLVRVIRPGFFGDDHASETEQAYVKVDVEIHNDGDELNFARTVRETLQSFGVL
jgi:hypothetical protein